MVHLDIICKLFLFKLFSKCLLLLKPGFHIIAHDRRIAENTARNRQRLYENNFRRPGDRQRLY